ncbi:MAG: Fe-S cluster assembly protein SufD [Candidatus Bipolaricaulota bacterium]|nr:Fe-S cluster assembly protein SufD [Candidatus Bipolaricaulota bacterium]MDW8031801.1 Fe-S cluster assembly protein SufD [Candidatus Bipolaricaulota bacterium]
MSTLRSFSVDTIAEQAASRGEPTWLVQKRVEAFEALQRLPLPESRYTKIRGLDLNAFDFAGQNAHHAHIGELAAEREAVHIQLDGQILITQVPESLQSKGIVFCDMATAIREHPDLVKQYLFHAISPSEDKMTALVSALASSGIFIYVPKETVLTEPVRLVYLLDEPSVAALAHQVIIIESGSSVTVLEEAYAKHPDGPGPHLHGTISEVYLGEGARMQFGALQNWNEGTYSFVRRRAHVGRDAKIQWTIGWLGGRLTMSSVESRLVGPGAEMEDIQVLFGRHKQHFDLTSSLRNMAPHVKGEIHMKGVLKDQARAVMYGFIRVDPVAQQSNSYQLAQGLLLNDGAHCDAIPGLEIEANDVRATHGASIGPIDEEQIFYLQSRGLDREQAKRTIVEGFLTPTLEQIPIAGVRERFHAFVEQKWNE